MNNRVTADERLDRLYLRSMRCPYCRTKILKGTTLCPNCGITKEQIYYAHLATIKDHNHHHGVLYTKVRPYDIPLWKMALGGTFGFLGIHCFIAKRYWRGIFMALLTVLFVAELLIFPPVNGEVQEAHPWRSMFETAEFVFPGDILGIIVIVMWVWDFCTILLGGFKYPVVLAAAEETK